MILGFVWVGPAFGAGLELNLSVNAESCDKATLRAEIDSPSPLAFSSYLDDVLIGSGTMGAGHNTYIKPKDLTGEHVFKFKVVAGEDTVEKSLSFKTNCADAGGGSMPPCLLDGTCPCIGFTYWEIKKGYCEAPHIILPAEYVRKQKLIQLVSLLERVVALYSKMVWGR